MARGKKRGVAKRGKAKKAKVTAKKIAQTGKADRALLLAHTERFQNLDHARRVRSALCLEAGEHIEGRAIQSGFPEDLSEQPHACDCRSAGAGRSPHFHLRVRCNSAVSRPQDRKVLSVGRACACRSRSVAVLANGRTLARWPASSTTSSTTRARHLTMRSNAMTTRSTGFTA